MPFVRVSKGSAGSAGSGQAVRCDDGAGGPTQVSGQRRRVLLFSTLYPSSARPNHGIFVETRLRELVASGAVEARVVAPVPWFFSTNPRYGGYSRWASTPRRETRHGIEVAHPRYPLPPKVGQTVAPLVLALGALPAVRRWVREGFDLIDAHYFYPDGVAAALIARLLGTPLVITARGSDLNVLGRHALPRWAMRWAADRADASIGVCRALVDTLREWGVEESKLEVMRNGVDLERFRPVPQGEARAQLGLQGHPLLLCVGNLLEVKGLDLVIAALALLRHTHPEARLCIVGDGPLRGTLRRQAESLGLASSVTFAGAVPNAELAPWYSAADALVLASRSEGWANVLLESMACGTPVVATRVGGSPEVVSDPRAGLLVESRNPAGIAAAIAQLLERGPQRPEVRRYAEGLGWDATTRAQITLFERVAGAVRSSGDCSASGTRP